MSSFPGPIKAIIYIIYLSLFAVGCGSKTVYEGFYGNNDSDKVILADEQVEEPSHDSIAAEYIIEDPEDQGEEDEEDKEVISNDDPDDQQAEQDQNQGQNQDQDQDQDQDQGQDQDQNQEKEEDVTLLGTPECSAAENTRSVLLTKTISRELVQKELLYEMYALDCAGKPIESGYISFDFDYITSAIGTLSYKILHSETDEIVMSGSLDLIEGEDIFGSKTEGASYYRTDKKIIFGSEAKLIFSIDVSSVVFTDPSESNAYDQLPTHLRIGSYNPTLENVKLLESGCLTEQESRVSALTEQLSVSLNTPSDIYLEYELYSKDCLGNAIEANQILFDLDYRFTIYSGEEDLVSYSIIDEENGQMIGSGSLILIRGEDLFGNSGSNFFYYKTSGDFDFPTDWNKLKLIISWPGVVFERPTTEDSDPNILPSFIKFGQNLDPAKKDIDLNFIP